MDARLAKATVSPLGDLNLMQESIPEVLKQARKGPYKQPDDLSCESLATEVKALDRVLGADLDTRPTKDNPSLIQQGSNAAADAMVGALKDTTEGIIPFRGWVRKLTGAERHARAVTASLAAGTIRRAYLKGLGQARGCTAPAAPAAAVAPAASSPNDIPDTDIGNDD
jgi:hypothetical protein